MQYNIKMYPYYYAACSFIAWMPIFFLYFSEILSLKEVLLLESIYYVAVVILEVPTGYFSDVVGRRFTLILGSVFLCAAAAFYLIGGSFWILVVGQLFFALNMSFLSGTNTVFHYESLQQLELDDSYGDREARVNKFGMIAGGTAALVGGLAATYGLYLAYIITLASGAISLIIALRFEEPKHESSEGGVMSNVIGQLTSTASYLNMRPLGWVFFYYVLIYAITHVPYEFYQSYLQILSDRQLLFGWSVPVISGLIYAGARYLGAFGAAYSMVWSRKFGLAHFLIICLLAVNLIVLVMGSTLHSAIVLVVLFRSLPWAAIKAPLNAIITPTIQSGQRATFHSMISLACRLSFFLTLLLLSLIVDHGQLADWDNLSLLLRVCALGGLVLTIPVWVWAYRALNGISMK